MSCIWGKEKAGVIKKEKKNLVSTTRCYETVRSVLVLSSFFSGWKFHALGGRPGCLSKIFFLPGSLQKNKVVHISKITEMYGTELWYQHW